MCNKADSVMPPVKTTSGNKNPDQTIVVNAPPRLKTPPLSINSMGSCPSLHVQKSSQAEETTCMKGEEKDPAKGKNGQKGEEKGTKGR
jgi:hypothetical protein